MELELVHTFCMGSKGNFMATVVSYASFNPFPLGTFELKDI